MNTTVRKPFLAMLLGVALVFGPTVVLTTTTGCTTSAKGVVYKTLAATAYSVDTAMKAYSDRIVAGKVSAGSQAKVRDVLSKYQAGMRTAIEAAQFNFQSATPEALAALATAVLTTISEVTQ